MTARKRHAHCSYCGSPFAEGASWPRTCTPCGSVSYLNPTPVGVVLLPVEDGILCVRRTIEPRKGELALPGGFLDVGETWQEGCARELREETGVVIRPDEVTLFAAHSVAREGVLLLFGVAAPRRSADLSAFIANEEASEMVVVPRPVELAFPLHTQVLKEYFDRQRR
jgi:ADP-ribose pyrophosphatase YjhB (NUDIX family)